MSVAACRAVSLALDSACHRTMRAACRATAPGYPARVSADGRPFIGETRARGLWLSTGHGHLGWTQAMGSAHLLADLLAGDTPAIDPTPYAARRV